MDNNLQEVLDRTRSAYAGRRGNVIIRNREIDMTIIETAIEDRDSEIVKLKAKYNKQMNWDIALNAEIKRMREKLENYMHEMASSDIGCLVIERAGLKEQRDALVIKQEELRQNFTANMDKTYNENKQWKESNSNLNGEICALKGIVESLKQRMDEGEKQMPSIKCSKCGGLTNTAVSNYLFPIREDDKANECYARRNKDNTKWEKGCTNPGGIMEKIVDDMIKEEEDE